MIMGPLILSLMFAGILTMSMMHMPMFLKRICARIPAGLQAAIIHFGYGGWLGGVTGHMVGAFLSVPMFFVLKYYLIPRFRLEGNEAWNNSWFNKYIYTPVSNFYEMIISKCRAFIEKRFGKEQERVTA